MTSPSFLPYTRQWIDDDDIAAVVGALKSDLLTGGPAVQGLERSFAETVSARHAVSSTSGTAALHLAFLAAGLGEGDTAIVPTLTFAASANAARYVGAEVVFADVDPITGLMTPDHLREALNRAGGTARAVVPVHIGGQTCAMAEIATVAKEHGLFVIEDACHALGGQVNGDPVGSCRHADATVFSLHPAKIITMGEGGMTTTNDDDLAQRLHRCKNHGVVRAPLEFRNTDMATAPDGGVNPWYHEFPDLSFNYRASDLNCALGLSQLKKLPAIVAHRETLMSRYRDQLAALSPLIRPLERVAMDHTGWHLSTVLIDFEAAGRSRAHVMNALKESGIGTQVHYIPVHRQPYYTDRYGALDLPGAEAYYQRTLSLPLFTQMQDADVDRVVDALGRALER